MNINAHLQNDRSDQRIFLTTNGKAHVINIEAKDVGFGSSVNGGELLCLALAVSYCDDLYREAGKHGIRVDEVEVEVSSEFGEEGEPARSIHYQVRVKANASEEDIRELMLETDRLAEVHKTLRQGIPVHLDQMEAVSIVSSTHEVQAVVTRPIFEREHSFDTFTPIGDLESSGE
jgi:uncharacterized OsmC-like protein